MARTKASVTEPKKVIKNNATKPTGKYTATKNTKVEKPAAKVVDKKAPPKPTEKAKQVKPVEKKESSFDFSKLEARLTKLEKAIEKNTEEVTAIRKEIESAKSGAKGVTKDKDATVAKGKDVKSDTSKAADKKTADKGVDAMKRDELISALGDLGIKEADVKRTDGEKGKPRISDFREALKKAMTKDAKKNKKNEKEENDIKVTVHPKKGYGTDKNGYVYNLVGDKKVVAKLVNDKPAVLTAKDIADLKKRDIPHDKKTAAELKKLLVPVEINPKALKKETGKKNKNESSEEASENDDDNEDIDLVESGEDGEKDNKETEESDGSDIVSSNDEESSKDESVDLKDSDESDETNKTNDEAKTSATNEEKTDAVQEESSSSDDAENDDTNTGEEKEDGDSSAEGKEDVKEDEDEKEGKEIAKHFEKPPEVTEADFKKFYTALQKLNLDVTRDPKFLASKMDMTEQMVGLIITKYAVYSKRWKSVIDSVDSAKPLEKTEKTTKASTTVPSNDTKVGNNKVAGKRQTLGAKKPNRM